MRVRFEVDSRFSACEKTLNCERDYRYITKNEIREYSGMEIDISPVGKELVHADNFRDKKETSYIEILSTNP